MRTKKPMTVLLMVFLCLVGTSCSQEGKIRSEMVAGCTSQGGSEEVCKCSFEKLKKRYGLEALIAMNESNAAPPDFAEALVSSALECRAGATNATSSALIGVGDAVVPVSSGAAGDDKANMSSDRESLIVTDEFGDVLELDQNGLPNLSVSLYGARGTGFGDGLVVVAKQVGNDQLRHRLCEKYKSTIMDTEQGEWKAVYQRCLSPIGTSSPNGTGPTTLAEKYGVSDEEMQAMYEEEHAPIDTPEIARTGNAEIDELNQKIADAGTSEEIRQLVNSKFSVICGQIPDPAACTMNEQENTAEKYYQASGPAELMVASYTLFSDDGQRRAFCDRHPQLMAIAEGVKRGCYEGVFVP